MKPTSMSSSSINLMARQLDAAASPASKDPCDERTTNVLDFLRELSQRLQKLDERLAQLDSRLSTNAPDHQQAYTTAEVASILGKSTFTVREWCRLGRVNAFRARSGRGPQADWRISREELCRIRSEGLLPVRYAHRTGIATANSGHQTGPPISQVTRALF